MELGSEQVVPAHHRRHRAAVVDARQQVFGGIGPELIPMHEVDISARAQPVQDRMLRVRDFQGIPAHVRNLERRVAGRECGHLARNPAQAGVVAMLAPDARHQLHADADAEERPAPGDHHLRQRLDHARERVEPGAAVAEGADSGQHHALGGSHRLGVGGDQDLRVQPGLAGGALEGLGRRAQVARAVIDDGDGHAVLTDIRPGPARTPDRARGPRVPTGCPWWRARRRPCAGRSRSPGAARAPGPCSRTRRYGACSRRRGSRRAGSGRRAGRRPGTTP